MQWFEIKEQSAGNKRLLLSWYLYKIFGKNVLYLIAFLVSFFTFIFAPKIRLYSRKYFEIAYPYINTKPTLVNQFKHILSYAFSLVDKLLVFCADFNADDIFFENKEIEKQLIEDIKNKKGVFLICNHIGNIEVVLSYSFKFIKNCAFFINIFMSHKQGQIFNEFLDTIKIDFPVRLFPIEEMGISTGVELKENLNNGDIVFIAGDRLSQNNDTKFIKEKLFNREILFPKGTFKLANLMDVPTYFISALKIKNKYMIIMESQKDLSEKVLSKNFAKFMERVIKINPFQFFQFYDFFN